MGTDVQSLHQRVLVQVAYNQSVETVEEILEDRIDEICGPYFIARAQEAEIEALREENYTVSILEPIPSKDSLPVALENPRAEDVYYVTIPGPLLPGWRARRS